MLDAWRDGADVVNMRRRARAGESWLKRATAYGFYRVMNRLSEVPIPVDTGDYRLLSRRAVDALNALPRAQPRDEGPVRLDRLQPGDHRL